MNASLSFSKMFQRIQSGSNRRAQAELAEILEVKQSSISNPKRRNSVPEDWYMSFFNELGVDPDWLKKRTVPISLHIQAGYPKIRIQAGLTDQIPGRLAQARQEV